MPVPGVCFRIDSAREDLKASTIAGFELVVCRNEVVTSGGGAQRGRHVSKRIMGAISPTARPGAGRLARRGDDATPCLSPLRDLPLRSHHLGEIVLIDREWKRCFCREWMGREGYLPHSNAILLRS